MGKVMGRFSSVLTATLVLLLVWAGVSGAAAISLVPSNTAVMPGEDLSVEVVVGGIPLEGLNAVQFRLNVEAAGASVTGVTDLTQALGGDISIAAPLAMSSSTTTRSGLGDFFLNGAGPNGVLALDNEQLIGGSALFTFAHTYGATRPVGGGTVATFMVHVGDAVGAESFHIYLADVALLDGGTAYALDYNQDTTIQLKCLTSVPDLTGMTLADVLSTLDGAGLVVGSIYEVHNDGTKPLGRVLEQSVSAGNRTLCGSAVDIAMNTAPVVNAGADKTANAQFTQTATATDANSMDYSWSKQSGPGNVTFGSPAGPSTTVSADADGTYTLRLTATDAAGNSAYSDTTLVWDTVAPTGSVTINSGASYTNYTSVILTLSASDTGSGVSQMQFSNDNTTWSDWEAFTTNKLWLVSSGEGQKTVYVQFKDAAGNIFPTYSSNIILTSSKLYIENSGISTISQANLDGTGGVSLGNLNGTLSLPNGIALDTVHGKMYVTNFYGHSVSQANLDGTGGVSLGNLNGTLYYPNGIALDTVHGKMYVTNFYGHSVVQANLDGTGGVSLGNLNGALYYPNGIALDTVHGKMYVTNFYGTVVQANLDGTGGVSLGNLSGMLFYPKGIALDSALGMLYVVNGYGPGGAPVVVQADLDGAGVVGFGNLNGALDSGPNSIALDIAAGKIYVTYSQGGPMPFYGSVSQVNLDGRGWVDIGNLNNTLFLPSGIALLPPSLYSTIVSPSDVDVLKGQSCTITGTVQSIGVGVQKMEIGITSSGGSTNWITLDSSATSDNWTHWSHTLTLPADGIYTVQSRATDNAGNVETVGSGVVVQVGDNTHLGQQVNVLPISSSTSITFSEVTTQGNTTVSTSGNIPTPPEGYQLGDPPTYYDIKTTAAYNPPVTICINYVPDDYSDISTLRLFHYENNAWVDITTSNDTVNHVICGTADSLSPFAVLQKFDTIPPVSAVFSPANGTILAGSDCTITGTASDGSGSGVRQVEAGITSPGGQTSWINTVTADGWTNWNYTYVFPADGVYTFRCRATDNSGNVESPGAGVSVTVDTKPPVLTLSMLPDGAVTANPVLNIAGSASDAGAGLKSLTINGIDITADVAGFSHALKLSEGANTITVTAKDDLDNQTTETRVITYDPTALPLTVTAPADNSKTNRSSMEVRGTAGAEATVDVKVNGGNDQLASRDAENFTSTAVLVPGINTIEVAATDMTARKTTEKRTVILVDATKPSLAITEPVSDTKTYQSSILIKGSVADALSDVTMTVMNHDETFHPTIVNGYFEQTVTFTDEGIYQIKVTATDTYGNETAAQRNIIYEKMSATLTADKPSPQLLGYPVTFTASATGGTGNYEYQFMLYNRQYWSEVRAYSSANTWTWDTMPGVYTVKVNVRNTGEDSTADASASIDYVVEYVFGGFLEPVSLIKPFKLGSTIPVKFQLKDYAGNCVSTATATVMLQQYSGDEPVGDPMEVISNADQGNVFRYDPTNNQYIYNLSTGELFTGSWMLVVYPGDGTARTSMIYLK